MGDSREGFSLTVVNLLRANLTFSEFLGIKDLVDSPNKFLNDSYLGTFLVLAADFIFDILWDLAARHVRSVLFLSGKTKQKQTELN